MVLENAIVRSDMENIFSRRDDWGKFENKVFLITGAYGMLASYLIFFLIYLVEKKHINIKIIAQGRNETRMTEVFGQILDKDFFCTCYCDICEPIPEIGRVDYIIHAAGIANPRMYSLCPVEVAKPNALGTYHLLQYASEHGTEGFLFFSSGDVYGKMDSNIEDITEDDMGAVDPLELHSCYSESKRMAETWCNLFYREKGLNTYIARIGHTYAPTMDIENDPRVFSDFMKCILEKRDIVMLSDGSAKRPFCYIADAIVAYMIILLDGKPGEAYNVCNTSEFLSIRQLAEVMISLEPEYHLNVIMQSRRSEDAYLENRINKQNKPVETKLKNLGWVCEYDTYRGFSNVLKYLQDKMEENAHGGSKDDKRV